VLVKFRDDISAADRERFIERSQWGRETDYVSGYTCGTPVKPDPYPGVSGCEWDWGMTLDIAESDVERYRDDPVHRAVGQEVAAFAARVEILDFLID